MPQIKNCQYFFKFGRDFAELSNIQWFLHKIRCQFIVKISEVKRWQEEEKIYSDARTDGGRLACLSTAKTETRSISFISRIGFKNAMILLSIIIAAISCARGSLSSLKFFEL